MNATATIGHNNPPEPTPYEAHKANIDDLVLEAQNFLDGEPIETEGQAEAVSKLLDDARKASTAAEVQRKAEAKPFDDGKAAVQALWKPLIGSADLAVEICKKALAPFLLAKDEAQRAAAEAARQEAERQAAAAREAAEKASETDLAGQATARILQENAAAAEKAANRLDKAKAHASGGERAVGLTSVWAPTLVTPMDALKHYMATQPEPLKAWLLDQARQDVRAGKRSIPGFEITETKVAR